ncbi:LuxR C-terminal-related transcriptional regulator [Peribacillus sp. NPDC097675]|uniref:LuxR C-terminal-related transcriptional regulator n=1 Tax=Peribacillus sp. NPDC097675 TaxID=3390618 RepID=UPI003D01E675
MQLSTTFLKNILSLRSIRSQEEIFIKLLELYLQSFPVKSAYLLRYSPIGHIGEGIIAIKLNDYKFITHYAEDLRNVPIIMQALQERRALYVKGIDYLKVMPSKYISNKGSEQFIVVPIFHGNVSLGYICGDEFDKNFQISNTLLEAFTLFGRLTGELFVMQDQSLDVCPLSKRELEVMQYVALGDSTKEIASSIQISDVTVNQYIKSAIKKMQAQNRVEAIVKLCKMGLI